MHTAEGWYISVCGWAILCVQVHCAMIQKRWHIMYTRLLVCVSVCAVISRVLLSVMDVDHAQMSYGATEDEDEDVVDCWSSSCSC